MAKILIKQVNKTSFAKAIRYKCLDCCAGNDAEVRKCTLTKCPLFPYRFGCSPTRAANIYKDKAKIIS